MLYNDTTIATFNIFLGNALKIESPKHEKWVDWLTSNSAKFERTYLLLELTLKGLRESGTNKQREVYILMLSKGSIIANAYKDFKYLEKVEKLVSVFTQILPYTNTIQDESVLGAMLGCLEGVYNKLGSRKQQTMKAQYIDVLDKAFLRVKDEKLLRKISRKMEYLQQ